MRSRDHLLRNISCGGAPAPTAPVLPTPLRRPPEPSSLSLSRVSEDCSCCRAAMRADFRGIPNDAHQLA